MALLACGLSPSRRACVPVNVTHLKTNKEYCGRFCLSGNLTTRWRFSRPSLARCCRAVPYSRLPRFRGGRERGTGAAVAVGEACHRLDVEVDAPQQLRSFCECSAPLSVFAPNAVIRPGLALNPLPAKPRHLQALLGPLAAEIRRSRLQSALLSPTPRRRRSRSPRSLQRSPARRSLFGTPVSPLPRRHRGFAVQLPSASSPLMAGGSCSGSPQRRKIYPARLEQAATQTQEQMQ